MTVPGGAPPATVVLAATRAESAGAAMRVGGITTVADLTGAPARPFRDWVAAHADSFRNAGGQGAA